MDSRSLGGFKKGFFSMPETQVKLFCLLAGSHRLFLNPTVQVKDGNSRACKLHYRTDQLKGWKRSSFLEQHRPTLAKERIEDWQEQIPSQIRNEPYHRHCKHDGESNFSHAPPEEGALEFFQKRSGVVVHAALLLGDYDTAGLIVSDKAIYRHLSGLWRWNCLSFVVVKRTGYTVAFRFLQSASCFLVFSRGAPVKSKGWNYHAPEATGCGAGRPAHAYPPAMFFAFGVYFHFDKSL